MIAPAAPVPGVFCFDIGPGFDEALLDGVSPLDAPPLDGAQPIAPRDSTRVGADDAQPVGFELDIAVLHE